MMGWFNMRETKLFRLRIEDQVALDHLLRKINANNCATTALGDE
ncbi:hypothetical protein [Yoonia sp.]|nr:hypothetical protein [Yoonia sp.]